LPAAGQLFPLQLGAQFLHEKLKEDQSDKGAGEMLCRSDSSICATKTTF
jgi:hypothetical protein